MKNKNLKSATASMQPKKHLSVWRLFIAIVAFAGIIYGSVRGVESMKEKMSADSIKPWFAPYVDVTATPQFGFEQADVFANQKNLVLSFIVSSHNDACEPSWGGTYSLDDAGSKLDLDRRVARYRQQGGNVAISFGGALNDELAINCKDEEKLKHAYLKVIERYGIDTIDLDIEGEGLKDADAMKRRSLVIVDLQKQLKSEDKKLAVWLTLPVWPSGLTEDGTNAVTEVLANGVDLAGVNVMTMDFAEGRDKDQSMQEASERALVETHRQLGILYNRAGIYLSGSSLWSKIGATPMIGQNDVEDEIFSLDDAEGLNEFASTKGIARMSMWSANRDIECGENYVNTSVVSDSCSGVKQERFAFAGKLSKGFYGDLSSNASLVTTGETEKEQEQDDPQKSPYQIWKKSGAYLQGTKVVWHHNVYEAKWWTSGDLPDNPVLQAWETPWKLIGPVLPGDTPVPQRTLPEGTYPNWSGTEIYDTGQRVLFNGVPYQAKWWTQGDSPAASTSNPDSSPWAVLTQEQIEEVVR
jgi:chitinase